MLKRRSPRQTPVRNSPKNRRSECASSIFRIQAIPPPKRNSASSFASSILDALLLKQIDATRNSKDWRHPVEVSRGVDLEAERFDEELARLAKVSPFVAVHGYIDNRDKSTERFIAHIRIFNCTIGSAKESSPTVTPLLVDEQEFQDTTEGMKTAAQLIVKKIEEVLEKLSSKGPQKSNEPHLGTSAPTK